MTKTNNETVTDEVEADVAEQEVTQVPGFEVPLADFQKWYDMSRDELVAYIKENMSDKFDIYDIKNPTGHLLYMVRKDKVAKILSVGHIDTVINHEDGRFVIEEAESSSGSAVHILHSPHNDDRQGIATMMEMFDRHDIVSDLLICDEEETGNTTSREYVSWRSEVTTEEDKDHVPTDVRTKEYNWLCEFDRRGTDVATYSYGTGTSEATTTFIDALEKHWGKNNTSNGSFTDICSLTSLGCKAFNVGVAYQNAHGKNGYFVVEQYAWAFIKFIDFYNEFSERKFEHTPPPPTAYNKSKYSYASGGYYGASAGTFQRSKRADQWPKFAKRVHILASPINNVYEEMKSTIRCTVFPEKVAGWINDDGICLSQDALMILLDYYGLDKAPHQCVTCGGNMLGGLAKSDEECASCEISRIEMADVGDVVDEGDIPSVEMPSLAETLASGREIGDVPAYRKLSAKDITDFLVGDDQKCSCCEHNITNTEYNTAVVSSHGYFLLCTVCTDVFTAGIGVDQLKNELIAATCLYCLGRTTRDYLNIITSRHNTDISCVACDAKYGVGEAIGTEVPYTPHWHRKANGKVYFINPHGNAVVISEATKQTTIIDQ